MHLSVAQAPPSQWHCAVKREAIAGSRHRDGGDVSERGGKKGRNTPIRLIHPGAVLTSRAGTGRPTTIGLHLSGLWDAPVGNVACVCLSIRMARRCSPTSTATPRKTPLVKPMNGPGTTRSSACISPSVTARKNGRAMRTAMVFVRSTPIPSRVCVRRHGIFCAPCVESTRNICTTIWPCANIKSISNASVPRLSLGSSPSTDQ